MTPEQKALANKIVALLALASSTTFAAEAETARRLAEQLMTKHKIEASLGEFNQDTIEIRTHSTPSYAMWKHSDNDEPESTNWYVLILSALCDFCSCTYVYRGKHITYEIIGTVWNLDVMAYMLHEIDRQRQRAWFTHKRLEDHDNFHRFCYGYASALTEKIAQITDSLYLQKNKHALITWYESQFGLVERSPDELSLGFAHSEAGLVAGKGASLHRGTVSSQSFKQIGRK